MSNNPLFGTFVRGMQGNNQANIINQFSQFRRQMQGKNPNEEIRKLLQSGQINQNQLNQAQQMAQQMQGMFKR